MSKVRADLLVIFEKAAVVPPPGNPQPIPMPQYQPKPDAIPSVPMPQYQPKPDAIPSVKMPQPQPGTRPGTVPARQPSAWGQVGKYLSQPNVRNALLGAGIGGLGGLASHWLTGEKGESPWAKILAGMGLGGLGGYGYQDYLKPAIARGRELLPAEYGGYATMGKNRLIDESIQMAHGGMNEQQRGARERAIGTQYGPTAQANLRKQYADYMKTIGQAGGG